MPREQLLLLAGAAVLALLLGLMPMVVVDNDDASGLDTQGQETAQTTENKPTHTDGAMSEGGHAPLSPEVAMELEAKKAAYHTAESPEIQRQALDSLMGAFRRVNRYDSAAYFAAQFADAAPSLANNLLAGDAYYEAFRFAMDGQKLKVLGENARKYFERVLEEEPQHAEARVKTGMTYVASEAPMQGILMIRKVVEEDPENELALFNLGILSMQSGQLDKAVSRFTNLLEVNPKHREARFYLGVAHFERNQREKAREVFEQLVQEEGAPNDPITQNAASYLEQLNAQP
jgi:tetratricopeptide (TPR) repeat protein